MSILLIFTILIEIVINSISFNTVCIGEKGHLHFSTKSSIFENHSHECESIDFKESIDDENREYLSELDENRYKSHNKNQIVLQNHQCNSSCTHHFNHKCNDIELKKDCENSQKHQFILSQIQFTPQELNLYFLSKNLSIIYQKPFAPLSTDIKNRLIYLETVRLLI
ncbi:hypothetical protein JXR93_00910 [bacterium]|nr:hypothetical protein [bacterium]